jgi:hypothetical protein
MAKSMTGSFYLTETVTMAAAAASGSRVQGVIDLGAYVNVPTGQCVAVESVDFIYQASPDFGASATAMVAGIGSLGVQLSDLNPGTAFVRADDQSLIASGNLQIDQPNNIATHTTDLYPDNFGPANLSEAFLVVNDSLYLVAGPDNTAIGAVDVYVTARIRCRVAKLSTKDWMAIAIQSTASDN